MTKKLFTLIYLLSFSITIYTQDNWSLLEIDKGTIKKTLVINTANSESKILAITTENTNKSIKFTPYIITIKEQKITSKNKIKLSEVAKKDEENINFIDVLKNGKILILSSTDKKNYELIGRIISEDGNIIKELKITEDIYEGSLNVDLFKNEETIKLSYYNKDEKAQNFEFLDYNLEKKSTQSIKIEIETNNDYPFGSILYYNNIAYGINFDFLDKAKDLAQKPQFQIFKFDINKGKILNKKEIKSSNHYMYPRYFINENYLDIFTLSSPEYDNAQKADLSYIKLNLSDLYIEKESTSILNLASIENESTTNMFNKNPFNKIFQNEKSTKDKSNSKNKIASAANFQVIKMRNHYIILYRLASEINYKLLELNYSTKRDEYVDYYNTTFYQSNILNFNPDSNKLILIHKFNNAFLSFGHKSSRLYLINRSGGEVSYTKFLSDTTKAIYAYVTGVDELEHTIYLNILTQEKKEIKEIKINPKTKGNTFFYLKTIKEIAPNVFICEAYTRGDGDKLFIVNLNN